jgi:hypothetical protein
MKDIHKRDPWSLATMAVTLVLFIGALMTKGFTHDLLLETGVFLVSAKLIIMAYKNSVTADAIQSQLQEIKAMIRKQSDPLPARQTQHDEKKCSN